MKQSSNYYRFLTSLKRTFLLFAMAIFVGPAFLAAQVFTVDSTSDAIDSLPGDSTCATTSGDCTLRAAIMESNALGFGHAIILPAGTYTLSIAGDMEDLAATGDLDVINDLIITGAGPSLSIIDGAEIDRVFDVPAGSSASLSISGVTIQNGRADNPDENGGGVSIVGDSFLDLTNVILKSNYAEGGGGAVYSSGAGTSISKSTLSMNRSIDDGGAVHSCCGGSMSIVYSTLEMNISESLGGGLFRCCGSGDTATVIASTISGNIADNLGGGVYTCCGGNLTLSWTTVSDNTANNEGGGMYSCCGGAIDMQSSTFSGNKGSTGGGIRHGEGAMLVGTNCTISGNIATADGGGLRSQSGADTYLTNVTIYDNTAATAGGISLGANIGDDTFLANTIIGANTPDDCAGDDVLTSLGTNLDSDTTCMLAGIGDISGSDPVLGTLSDNGSKTLTHLPLSGSPVVDTGNNAYCPDLDQRDLSRPNDGNNDGTSTCDIGAVEQFLDCNSNDVLDVVDIGNGTSADCDADGVPDECQSEAELADCLVNDEFHAKIAEAKLLLKKIKKNSPTLKADKVALKAKMTEIVDFVAASKDKIALVDASTNLDSLAIGARRKVKKAFRVNSLNFRRNKKRAKKALVKLDKAAQ